MASRYWILLILPALGLAGWYGGQIVTITLIFGAVWATFAIGYDLFSGYSGRVNLGYAMFPGTSAYVTAVLSAKLGVPPVISMFGGVLAAVLLALVIGMVALRIKGIYFALSTSIVPLALFQITHVFGEFFGGEEGVWGVPGLFFDPRPNLLVMLSILAVVLAFALWFSDAKPGLMLRAIKGGDLTAQALGVDTFRFLLLGFLVSALIGGVGGAYLAHFQMFVGPELLFIITTLQVITFVQVGGPATIIGPTVAAFLLVIFNEYLREWSDWRLFLYFVALVLLLRFAPKGLIIPAWRKGRQMLGALLAGRTEQFGKADSR